jgi:lycopene beta-cyclase
VSLPSSLDNSIRQADYIIIGAGCAGLSLAVRLAQDAHFADKKILIIDKAPKSLNDRTWCLWENKPGYFEQLVHHRWSNMYVRHALGSKHLNMQDYAYKLIRGIDFYKHCFQIISQAPNVQVHYGAVSSIDAAKGEVITDGGHFAAAHIFSSVLLQEPELKPGEFYLLQHFRGWWIETDEDFFDPTAADLMNFRTGQQHGCAFVYVLPISKRRALVEYTLFTEDTLQDHEYDDALKQFIAHEMQLTQYQITEVENGIIPMTNLVFPTQQEKITYIGTAGGQTKASTGYTFQYIQKHSDALVAALRKTGDVNITSPAKRFRFYDSVLLRVLHERKLAGADVFYRLFLKNPASRVFRFLDNETSFPEELQIMNSTPKGIFVSAALKELSP